MRGAGAFLKAWQWPLASPWYPQHRRPQRLPLACPYIHTDTRTVPRTGMGLSQVTGDALKMFQRIAKADQVHGLGDTRRGIESLWLHWPTTALFQPPHPLRPHFRLLVHSPSRSLSPSTPWNYHQRQQHHRSAPPPTVSASRSPSPTALPPLPPPRPRAHSHARRTTSPRCLATSASSTRPPCSDSSGTWPRASSTCARRARSRCVHACRRVHHSPHGGAHPFLRFRTRAHSLWHTTLGLGLTYLPNRHRHRHRHLITT